jgi:hypothetical protein
MPIAVTAPSIPASTTPVSVHAAARRRKGAAR